MIEMRTRSVLVMVALALAGGGIAACGGDEDASTDAPAPATATTPQATGQSAADGEQVFTANCASCHTLEAAGAAGQVGPNLDDAQPDAETVAAKVRGGGGGMPAFEGVLSDADIDAVAGYVAQQAGG